ncbi:MAG: ABC transporter substrate-binding protein [Rhodocyclales bacterium]|nr:ABC transporter substrate-binding protein [Rhodocyclales bacterium]
MKKKILASLSALALGGAIASAPAMAQNVKVAYLVAITGPIAGMAPMMVQSMKFAAEQVNAQGGIGNGGKLDPQVYDSGCNPQLATDAATKAVNVNGVIGIVGPSCSGPVIAVANSVSVPAGVLLVTSSGTSPKISTLDDKDLVFRTVPSDDYQGRALARALKARGIDKVAVTYLNNDYGLGLAEAFADEFQKQGGTITASRAHEDKKASYRSDLAELAKGGADTLVVFAYGNSSGLTILRQAIENGFFKNFVGADGMRDEGMVKTLGPDNLKPLLVSAPAGATGAGFEKFGKDFKATGGDPNGTFAATSYDAAFLMALAIEKAGGDKAKLPQALREVATAPGEPILPGEWAKAKKLIAEGKDIDYKGAAGDHEFDAHGDVPGSYILYKVSSSGFAEVERMK